jgi:hypothetical protein
MNLPDLTIALVSAMLAWTPPTEHAWTGESGLDTIARYHHIARVSAEAALDEAPLPGLTGPQSAALLVAVGSMESGGWAKDVQDCTRGGDGGKSWTVFGLWGSRAGVCDDLKVAAHVAISRLRDSMETCRGPAELSLTRYASGHCGQGRRESRNRWRRGLSVFGGAS